VRLAAVETLGATDLDKWDEVVKKAEDEPDPVRRFFMIAAVRDLRTFMAVVARIIPTHVTHAPPQRYMTVEMARAELRAAGIPEDVLDPDPIVGNPYFDDAETDDEGSVSRRNNE
jgi:hypothetical protein